MRSKTILTVLALSFFAVCSARFENATEADENEAVPGAYWSTYNSSIVLNGTSAANLSFELGSSNYTTAYEIKKKNIIDIVSLYTKKLQQFLTKNIV